MTALDIFCLIIVGILALQGLWYGFLKGLFFLVAWVAAAFGAYFSYDLLGNFMIGTFDLSSTTIHVICIAVGFLLPYILLTILGRLLHGAVSKTVFSIPNRLLGVLLGLVKAAILCTIIITIIHILPLTGSWEEGRNASISYALYLQELQMFGFDTKQPDIKGFVAEKAESAVENAKKTATDAVEKTVEDAVDAAKNSAEKAVESAKEKAKEAVK